jgi:serine/threonine-protein kinase
MSTLEQVALPDSAGRENLRRLFAATEQVTGRYAADPEAWVALGEARFHFGAGLGVSDVMTLEAFERAIELDSAYAPAYIHAIQLALYLSRPAAARQYLTRYLDLRPAGQAALAAWVTSLLLNSAVSPTQIDRVLDTVPSSALVDTWSNFILAPDSAEVAIEVARRLTGRRISEDVWWQDPVVRQGMLAVSLGLRGHLREAARIMIADPEFVDWPLFTELAIAGAIPTDSVASLYGIPDGAGLVGGSR